MSVRDAPQRLAARKVVKNIPVGKRPRRVRGARACHPRRRRRAWGLAVSRDGKRLYVANGLSDDMTVIDAQALKALRVAACRTAWSSTTEDREGTP